MTRYNPVGGKIVGNGIKEKYYSNRNIYEGNTSAYIMAGDRPHLRLCRNRKIFGTLRMFKDGKPLDLFDDVRLEYTPNVVRWTVRDGESTFDLIVTTPGDGLGFVLRVEPKTRISFVFRGIAEKNPDPVSDSSQEYGAGPSPDWNLCVFSSDRSLLYTEFDPSWMVNNNSGRENGICYIENKEFGPVYGNSGRVYLVSDEETQEEGGVISGCFSGILASGYTVPIDVEGLFRAGIERGKRISAMLEVDTPDDYINAAAQAAVAEMDASWHSPKTMHGNLCWNCPFVGWMVHGQHMIGQHDRSMATLEHYACAQVKDDVKRGFSRDVSGTIPAKDSRFYGQGYISEDQHFYNMQTQFFHQMISAWRYSGSEKMGEILREALRLHLKREDECFDPDGSGLYESVINTWPSDSVYTPGGAVEETCFVYFAYKTLAEMTEGEERENCLRKAEKIKKAFEEKLWITERGYPGEFVERFGKHRLHRDSWIYASFLPIECELTDLFTAAQCIDYPEWALKQEDNGLYWISNWTPGIWSVRECSSGENMQLAIAGFKAGKTDRSLKILSDFSKNALNKETPGELTYPVIEAAVQITRAIVEGLFGYSPNYPDGKVTFSPSVPFSWEKANIKTPDFELNYTRSRVRIKLARPANIVIRMRLYAEELISTEGAVVTRLIPGIGGMILEADMGFGSEADLKLNVRGSRDFDAPEVLDSLPHDMSGIYDPQNSASTPWGHHMMFRKMPGGWYREILLDLGKDPKEEELQTKQRRPIPENPIFESIDITGSMNADVCDIFKQKYDSLRSDRGCHAEIGYDGFSLWTFHFWGIKPPELKIDKHGTVVSGSGIPVYLPEGKKNVVFTSLWDNFPDSVEIPVKKNGRMICLAVAGSTNPNLCGIENAVITFRYENGETEKLPLVNPKNYIQLCPYSMRTSESDGPDRSDVFNPIDADLIKDFTPEILPLGEKLRALLIRWPLKNDEKLDCVKLEAVSPDIVVGIIAATIIK